MTTAYEIIMGTMVVFLLGSLLWSVLLRRKVKEQTNQIRRQLERELALEQQYAELFENAHDIIFTLDQKGRFRALNAAGEKTLGYTRDQGAVMTLEELVTPESKDAYRIWMLQLAQQGQSGFELTLVAKGGNKVIIEVNARLLMQDSHIVGVDGIARDITARKAAEDALRESEERFASAFRVSPVAIGIMSLADDCFHEVNESFLTLFGYGRNEVLGRRTTELAFWSKAEQWLGIRNALLQNKSVNGVECRFRTKAGEERIALVFMEQLLMRQTPCALFFAHDITQRHHLENELRQVQKLEAVGRLAAGVAHDFNNLLTIIQGNIELSRSRANLTPQLEHSLEQVSNAAQKATGLVRQLLTFSRKQVMQPQRVNLNELLGASIKMLKHLLPSQVVVRINFAPDIPIVRADPIMVEQVLMNLVVNARDAMPRGGEITLSTTTIDISADYVKLHPEASEGKHICLAVTDTGCGMDAETQAKIFEPFFTTKANGKGTGLGLATVYGVVRQHNGWIEVESVCDRGTTFRIFFPCSRPADELQPPAVTPTRRDGPQTVLVVEDEPTLAQFVSALLRANNFKVLEAANALQAIEVWNQNRGEVDLVLTDVMLGKGMSGLELAENLNALRPDLNVVYTSGYNIDSFGHPAELKEGVNYLAKPYPPPRLLQAVRRSLAGIHNEPALPHAGHN